MIKRALLVVAVIAMTGCGESTRETPPDAPLDVPSGDACLDLRISVNEVAAQNRVAAFVDALRAGGAKNATFDVAGEYAAIHMVSLALANPTPDPAQAALELLATLSPELHVDELVPEVTRDWSTTDAGSMPFMRQRVGTTNTRFMRPAVQVSVKKRGNQWWLESVELWSTVAFATAADAALLASCTRATPPSEAPIRAKVFSGMSTDQCLPVGTYDYTPHADDPIAWLDRPIRWEAPTLPDGAFPTHWKIVRAATLAIAPMNYWPNVNSADCYCGPDEVGFSLDVDAVTGDVLRYRPGLGCVVC